MAATEWAGIRVFMRDRQKFLRDAAAVSAATRSMERAAEMYGVSSAGAAKSSFLWNQALFTLRRTIYMFTIASAGAIAGVATLGFRFDMMRENSQVAFTTLLNSASAARTELGFLFELAAQTPFEFQNIQQFARQFLGWGFSIQSTNRYLKDFANVIAAMGGDVSIMDRISLAFGQIRSSGVLLGQDLRQLQQAIPGVAGMLQKQLGLTPAQMGHIGALRIPSNIAIEAIMRGIEGDPRFAGAAKALQGTVQGQLSTLHDYASRLFGDIMLAPFEAVRGGLPRLNAALRDLSATMSDRGWGAFVDQLDEMAGAGGHLADLINAVTGILTNGARVVAIFGQSMWDVGRIALPLVIVGLQATSSLLALVADNGTALRIVLDLLIARFLIIKGIAFLVWLRTLANLITATTIAIRAMTTAEIINALVGFNLVTALRRMVLWLLLAVPEIWALVSGEYALIAVTWLQTAAQAALNAAIAWSSVMMRRFLLWLFLAIPELWALVTVDYAAAASTGVLTAATWISTTALYAWNTALAWSSTMLRRLLLWILLAVPELYGLATAIWANVLGLRAGLIPALRVAVISFVLAFPFVTTLAIAFWNAAGAAWAFTAAILANPITWIVVGIVALIAGLVVLYLKWQAFHDLVDRFANFVIAHWPLVMLAVGGLAIPLMLLIKLAGILLANLDRIISAARTAWGWISALPKPLTGEHHPSQDRGGFFSFIRGGAPLLAGQQHGGITTQAGWSMIGEAGPELMWMQPGAHVVPLDRAPEIAGMQHEVAAEVPIIIKLDSAVLAEAVARVSLRQKARA